PCGRSGSEVAEDALYLPVAIACRLNPGGSRLRAVDLAGARIARKFLIRLAPPLLGLGKGTTGGGRQHPFCRSGFVRPKIRAVLLAHLIRSALKPTRLRNI